MAWWRRQAPGAQMMMNRTAHTDRNGKTTRLAYDENGRLTTVTDPLGHAMRYIHDPAGNITTVTDRNGNASVHTYDGLNRRISAMDPLGYGETWIYDAFGKVLSYTNQEGQSWGYGYDWRQRLISSVDPLGNEKTFVYDKQGNLIARYDEEGRGEYYSYDPGKRLIQKSDDLDQAYQYAHDGRGNVVSETDPEGVLHQYAYTMRGELAHEINRLGKVQSYTYDKSGNLIAKTDYNGLDIRYSYNRLGQLIRETHDGQLFATWEYDPQGNLILAENDTTEQRYAYDAVNKLTESFDSLSGKTTRFAYDPQGNRTNETLVEDGVSSSYSYDLRNQLATVTDVAGGLTTYAYTPAGRQASRELPSGLSDSWAYDEAGLLVSHVIRRKHGGYGENPVQAESHVYNKAGQRLYDITHEGKITAYTYDETSRLIRAEYPAHSGKEESDLSALFEAGLRPRGYTRQDGSVAGWSGLRVTAESGDLGRFRVDEYEGEALEDIEIFRSRYGEGGYSQHLYSRLDVAYEERSAVQDAYTTLSGYGYLDLNQRVWREEFAYDSRGNRTQQTSPWGTLESSNNAASQLLQTGNRSFAYDDNGNLINGQLGDQITSYEYDGRNRLVSVQDSITLPKHPWNSFWHNRGDGSINPFTRDVSYGYDALGRRNHP